MHREPDGEGGKAALVAAVGAFAGDSLRDVWLFDQEGYESLFLREDVSERLEPVEVGGYIDNERYGYVTRATYKQLYYADYEYTVRGFDRFEQFRTFLAEGSKHNIGVLVSIDRREGGYDYADLHGDLRDVVAKHGISGLAPAADRS